MNYLADYILLLNTLNKLEEAKKLIRSYKRSAIKQQLPAYALALNLFLEPTNHNYQALNMACSSACHFNLYHRAIMKHLKHTQQYTELELYARKHINDSIGKKVFLANYYLGNFFMAYITCALKNLSKPEFAAVFHDISIKGVDEKSFLYNQLITIRN